MTLTKHYNALTIPQQALKTTNLHVINPIFNFWKFTYIFYFTTHIDVRPVLEETLFNFFNQLSIIINKPISKQSVTNESSLYQGEPGAYTAYSEQAVNYLN